MPGGNCTVLSCKPDSRIFSQPVLLHGSQTTGLWDSVSDNKPRERLQTSGVNKQAAEAVRAYRFSASSQPLTAACLDWFIKWSNLFKKSTGVRSDALSPPPSCLPSDELPLCPFCGGAWPVLSFSSPCSAESSPLLRSSKAGSTGMDRDFFRNMESLVYILFALLICSICKRMTLSAFCKRLWRQCLTFF